MRKSAGLGLALVLVAAGPVFSAAPAAAHASLIGSSPEDGATLDDPPTVVELEFNEAIQRDFSQVAVLDSDENHYEQGDPEVVGGTVTQAVEGLADGEYQISYRVGSSDGHPVTGVVAFTVAGEGADVSADSASDEPAAAETSERDWVPIAISAATALIVVAAAIFLVVRRRAPAPRSDDPEGKPE